MTYFPVISPFEVFTDLDGKPLENGYIYIGKANQNPVTNPIIVTWDVSGIYPAAQPVRTLGGYPQRNGSPGKLFVNAGAFEDYSILVRDKQSRTVYYSQSTRFDAVAGGNSVDILADLRDISGYNQPIYVRGHTAAGDGGGGIFEWFEGATPGTYVDDNGITVVPTGGDGSGGWLRQFSGRVIVDWFGSNSTPGTTDMSAAIQSAIDTGFPIEFKPATYRLSTTISSSGPLDIIGLGEYETILLVDEGITGIRITGGQIKLKDFLLRCNRTISGTWSSTDSKGIYCKNGPDNTASNPTAYIESINIENVIIQRFYESLEITGAYWVNLEEVQTIYDFYGFIFNRNNSSGFTGTTLSIKKCWARGTGGSYSNVTNSIGYLIWDYTDLNFIGCASERHDYIAQIRTIQSGNLIDFYAENSKFGPYFHTITGKIWLQNIYYNNVGDQFSSGGWTLYVAYGILIYTSSKFISTDNTATIDTNGSIFELGQELNSRSGANSNSYSVSDLNTSKHELIHSNDQINLRHNRAVTNLYMNNLTASTNKRVVISAEVGVPSDWRVIQFRLRLISNRANSSTNQLRHDKLLNFSYINGSSINSIANDDLYLPGGNGITLVSQNISGGTITINIDLTGLSSAWYAQLDVEANAIDIIDLTAVGG